MFNNKIEIFFAQANYFKRHDVALPGFHKFFKENSDEEREHAQKFIKFQQERGGNVVLSDIAVSLIFSVNLLQHSHGVHFQLHHKDDHIAGYFVMKLEIISFCF